MRGVAQDPVTGLDLLTLGIAVLGALTGLASLVWQAVSFVLSGGRPKVELLEAWLGTGGGVTGVPGTWPGRRPPVPTMDQEHLAVRVSNVGRLPLSVTSWGIKIGPTELSHTPGGLWNKPLPYRLDVGEQQTWFVDRAVVDKTSEALRSSKVRGSTVGERVVIKGSASFGTGITLSSATYHRGPDGRLVPTRRRWFRRWG